MAMHTVDKRLYYTADKARVVEEGDPEAAFLYATPGQDVPADEYRRLTRKAEAAEPAVVYSSVAPPEDADQPKAAESKATHKADVEDKAVDGPRAQHRGR